MKRASMARARGPCWENRRRSGLRRKVANRRSGPTRKLEPPRSEVAQKLEASSGPTTSWFGVEAEVGAEASGLRRKLFGGDEDAAPASIDWFK